MSCPNQMYFIILKMTFRTQLLSFSCFKIINLQKWNSTSNEKYIIIQQHAFKLTAHNTETNYFCNTKTKVILIINDSLFPNKGH